MLYFSGYGQLTPRYSGSTRDYRQDGQYHDARKLTPGYQQHQVAVYGVERFQRGQNRRGFQQQHPQGDHVRLSVPARHPQTLQRPPTPKPPFSNRNTLPHVRSQKRSIGGDFSVNLVKPSKILKIDTVDTVSTGDNRLEIKEDGGVLTFKFNAFKMNPSPKFNMDIGLRNAAVVLPKTNPPPNFKGVNNWQVSSSFFGNNCTNCKHLKVNHSIIGNRIFFLGDNFLPAMIGSRGDCAPTIRINEGSFDQLKEVLKAQLKSGLKIKPVSESPVYACVSLLSHLCKVGAQEFWLQLDSFSTWMEKELGWVVVPFLLPYPLGLSDFSLVAIQQFLTILKGKYLSDLNGNFNKVFGMWRPLSTYMSISMISKKNLLVPHTFLKTNDVILKYLECEQDVWTGVDLCFENRYPLEAEKVFLPLLFEELSHLAPPSSPLKTPSENSLQVGFLRGIVHNTNLLPLSDNLKLVLMGASILGLTEEQLRKVIQDHGINVINVSQGGDFFKNFPTIEIPQSNNIKDTMILHIHGNSILKKSKFYPSNNIWHLLNPRFLNESEFEFLLSETVKIIEVIRKRFKGKILLIGPFPRHLTPCCSNPSHRIAPSKPFTTLLHYILCINQYLSLHPALRLDNLEFITFSQIFNSRFPKSYLKD